MSITRRGRIVIRRLLSGESSVPQAFTIGLADPQKEITVWLHGMGELIDVTNRHSMACADPFRVCIAFDEDRIPSSEECNKLLLKFCEREGDRRTLGQINLAGKNATTILVSGGCLILFRARHSANFCLPKRRIWVHYFRQMYSLWRKFDSAGVKMSFLERRAVMVVFIRPHPVVWVSLENEFGGNIFPMNIMGDLGNGCFAFALKNSRLAARLVERSNRVALSSVPLDQTPQAYRLGVNHGKISVDWDQVPFATKLSNKFGLRVPGFAQRVRELEVQKIYNMGSHTFFVAQIVHDERTAVADGLSIVHGFYQAWRLRGKPETLRSSLLEDLFNKRGTPHSSLPL
jgi:flavin reductase (DIM6/NTAB) family NADH-FMN oxidoreductase RutF